MTPLPAERPPKVEFPKPGMRYESQNEVALSIVSIDAWCASASLIGIPSPRSASGPSEACRERMKDSIPVVEVLRVWPWPGFGDEGRVPARDPGAVRPPESLFSMRARRNEAYSAGVCESSTAHRSNVSATLSNRQPSRIARETHSRTRAMTVDSTTNVEKAGEMSCAR